MILESLKLVQKFKELYCLYTVVAGVENEIDELFLSSLPLNIADKIDSISIEPNGDNFLVLDVFVANEYRHEVLDALKETYPKFEWEPEKGNNFTDIYLRLDDDVIAYLPTLLYEV